LDERIMHLFSIIAGQVQNRQDLFTKEGKIMDALLSRGCHLVEADTALMLMQEMVRRRTEQFFDPDAFPSSAGMRAMNTEERSRFTLEAFGFVTKLAHLGLISEVQREALIEKALTGQGGRIDLDHVKALAALFLFIEDHGHDDAHHPIPRRMRDTAWN
jgi:uncharacterized protein Smg (DUF494 family)